MSPSFGSLVSGAVVAVCLLPFVFPSVVSGSSAIVEIHEENWENTLKGEWMIEFFAPWCPACRALQPAWEEFGEWTHDLDMAGVGQVDVTKSPGLSGRFMVTALPTIFHVNDGEFRQYRGPRDKDSLISFIEEKKWTELETLSSWKDPKSVQMSMVSQFFKMSMLLRNVHTVITEEWGLPSWASYVGFALATILIGALMGLVLVCCIDCIYPPGKAPSETAHAHAHAVADTGEDANRASSDEDDDAEANLDDDLPEDDRDEAAAPEPAAEEEEEEDEEEEEEDSADVAVSESVEVGVRKRRAKRAD